ncbi:MAG: hypothetical protein A2V66_03565 [Ignavibacteria bacterium RBG_13_36_8]|nr:MAG: hypothetical protein A2V66_03565 [Ignavibacteria bacterium RBG_13_36_8]
MNYKADVYLDWKPFAIIDFKIVNSWQRDERMFAEVRFYELDQFGKIVLGNDGKPVLRGIAVYVEEIHFENDTLLLSLKSD